MMAHSDCTQCSDLPELEHALLWCMRAWVIRYRHSRDVSDRIEPVFAKFGAVNAAGDLDEFMWAVCEGALKTIEINCVCYPDVSADERILLDAFAALQRRGQGDAYTLLTQLIAERCATIACNAAHRVALAFTAAGRLLPAPRASHPYASSRSGAIGSGTHRAAGRPAYLH